MKKFTILFFLIIVLIGVMFPPVDFHLESKVVFADTPGQRDPPGVTPGQVGSQDAAIAALENSSGGCSIWHLKSCIANLIYIPLHFAAWILWLGGVLLNKVLEFTVIEMAARINAITGINIAWGVIRDLANILFIFILIYGAIQTILGAGGKRAKEVIVGVVIAAILINFSMFFTKLIVDASNLVAITFYQPIAKDSSGETSGAGLATSYMRPLKLSTLFSPNNSPTGSSMLAEVGNDLGKLTVVSIGGSIFLVITAFVFFAVAIMFIIRFVQIIFLLILSPIGLLGSVIPGMKSNSEKWWKLLMNQAIFAPVYMIMTWVVLTIFNSGGFILASQASGSGQDALSNAFSGTGPDTFGLIINFIVIIAFAIGTLIIAKQVADQGGTAGQKIVGSALGLGAGLAGFGGRKFIGGAARSMADSESLKEQASKKGLAGMGARLALRTSQKAAGASFDVRSSKTLEKLGGATGFDIGKEFSLGKAGGKGGYDDVVKKKIELNEKFAKSLGTTELESSQAEAELKDAKNKYTENSPQYREARSRVDALKGVSQKEAAKRVEEALQKRTVAEKDSDVLKEEKKIKEEIAEKEKDILNELNPTIRASKEKELQALEIDLKAIKIGADARRAIIEKDYKENIAAAQETKSISTKRKEGYATHLTTPNWIGTTTIPFSGKIRKIKRENMLSAIKIRKDESTKDALTKAVKKFVEEEEQKEEKPTTPSAPPATGSPSTTGPAPTPSP